MRPEAFFFDRDGTLIHDRDYLADPDGVGLLEGARDLFGALRRMGCKLFLFTNQSGVGRGYFPLERVEACNRRLEDLLGGAFLETGIAPEHPDAGIIYRKPSHRFIAEMLRKYRIDNRKTFLIGDKRSDCEAGIAAGVNAIFLNATNRDVGSEWSGRVHEVTSLRAVMNHFHVCR